MGRLVRTELKLMIRDPLMLTFVFAFPIVTMLIIGGAFGTDPDPAFDGVNPAHWCGNCATAPPRWSFAFDHQLVTPAAGDDQH